MSELMRRAAPGAALAGLALTTVWVLDPGLHADPQPTALPATTDSSAGTTDDTATDDATTDTGSQESTTDTGTGADDATTDTDTGTGTDDSSDGGSSGSDAATTPEASSGAASDCSDTTTVTGDEAMTRWGPVQVQMELAADGSVCSVQAVAYPENDPKSARINSYAIPSLDAQASEVGISFDAVSGATYTSEAYRESMQSILDRR